VSASPPSRVVLGRPLVWLGEVRSTNDVARLIAAAGGPEGAVVVADRQTHGRGRLGRAWSSPPGGLWCSILLRPTGTSAGAPTGASTWGRISLTIAVAVAEAVEAELGLRVGIRWPNDLLVGDRKVCGILIEATSSGALIVGIGLNVHVDIQHLPAPVAARATSLHLATGRSHDRRLLLAAMLARLAHWYEEWRSGSLAVLDAWAARDVMQGTRVSVGAGGPNIEGVAAGVDDDGALLVVRSDGSVARVVAGDPVSASVV
jgi:BirA family transcriptional regulator, biotin operon repressor / biotin---[acetyl-CoA-carboxylase] ligase